MKIDLLITPVDKVNTHINQKNYLQKYFEKELEQFIKLYEFDNIYIHISNKKHTSNLKNITYYNCNIGELVNNQIQNNFFFYNCFTSTFFTNNDNIVLRYLDIFDNQSLISSPCANSPFFSNNLSQTIESDKNLVQIYEKYFKNQNVLSTDYHFTNFYFAFININVAKEIKFATNYKNYNEEFIIDYYYRLKTQNIDVLTDFTSIVKNTHRYISGYYYSKLEYNLTNTWSSEYLHYDDYKNIYAMQFDKYLLKQKQKQINLKPGKSILYVTTPFNWVNGMTKHVSDLIKTTENTHIYVFETPQEPKLEHEFYLNHYYNNVLINIETYSIFDFNHLNNMVSKNYDEIVEKILIEKNINIAHIHILALGHKLNFASICKKNNVKTILSIHDLFYIGGEYTQESLSKQFDNKTLAKKYNIENITKFDSKWKNQIQELFNDVDKIIFYTDIYYDLFSKFYIIDKNKCQIIEHGSKYEKKYELNSKNNKSKTFNLLYFGRVREEKGILHLINYAKKIPNIKIYIIGNCDEHKLHQKIKHTKNIKYLGSYSNIEELIKKIKPLNIHAKIIPAIWHEAFNFTLSEAIILGLYPIVYNYGALKSRLDNYEIGTILKTSQAQELEQQIQKIRNLDSKIWAEELNKVNKTHIPSVEEMNKEYQKLYSNLYNDKICTDLEIDYQLFTKRYNRFIKSKTLERLTFLNKKLWNPKLSIFSSAIFKIKNTFGS